MNCGQTHVLLPARVLLRRADEVTVIGAALGAKAGGCGHRQIATRLGRAASTVRGWLRRIGQVAERVLAVLGVLAAEFGTEFLPVGTDGGAGCGGGGDGRGAGQLGGSPVGWFVLAVVAGRGGLWWLADVPARS